MSTRGDWAKAVKAAKSRGWIEARHGKHLILTWPATGASVPIPNSPSDVRAMKNKLAQMRRYEGATSA